MTPRVITQRNVAQYLKQIDLVKWDVIVVDICFIKEYPYVSYNMLVSYGKFMCI